MPSMIIAAVALTIALASFLINAYQVTSRHRPWVFVSSLRQVPEPEYLDLVEIEVTNLGQLPARSVEMSTTWGTYKEIESGDREDQPSTAELGVIFPNQQSRSLTGLGVYYEHLASGLDAAVLQVKLTYSGSLVLIGLGRHTTKQYLFLGRDGGWGTSGAGQADYT